MRMRWGPGNENFGGSKVEIALKVAFRGTDGAKTGQNTPSMGGAQYISSRDRGARSSQ